MRILVTNDDGIFAEGILALKRAIGTVGEVVMLAPERPRSAAGHAITLHKPLRVHSVKLPDGSTGYATNGTPTDCVTLAVYTVLDGGVELVMAGINNGANLGWDVSYSGTVAAAIEGAILGIPSVAISMAGEHEDDLYYYETGGEAACTVARMLAEHPLPQHTFLNVNVPNVPPDQIRGYQVTTLGRRQYVDRLEARTDPRGRTYYWLSGSLVEDRDQPGTDVYAVAHRYVSITPLHLDHTAYDLIEPLRAWLSPDSR